jgi:hypothetical protein
MKIYSIIITIIALLALIGGIYFCMQYNTISRQYSGMSEQIENCQGVKAETERQLSDAQDQLSKIKKTNDVLIIALNAFMIPGDLKAITVGSQESAEVLQKISGIADSKDRMMAEESWNNFKNSKLLNSLFDFLRSGVNNIERIMIPKI